MNFQKIDENRVINPGKEGSLVNEKDQGGDIHKVARGGDAREIGGLLIGDFGRNSRGSRLRVRCDQTL